jgi:hypothetical protein
LYRDQRISAVEAARVISDDDRGLLTWTASGSMLVRRGTFDGASIRKMPVAERNKIPTMLIPSVWHGGGVLILTPPDSAHSVWWFFDSSHRFEGWYVNLERPLGRWHGGIDIQDQALDIWVEPDRTWEWKDEDELQERIGHSLYWNEDEVPEIRAEGHRVISKIEAGVFPFDGTWLDFVPDPHWTPSTMPINWDTPK